MTAPFIRVAWAALLLALCGCIVSGCQKTVQQPTVPTAPMAAVTISGQPAPVRVTKQ